MAKNLLIVESPAKSKTLKKFLKGDFDIMATVGHIIDLPKSKTGVDVADNFKPDYVVIDGKEKVLKALRAAARKADHIYLAPDPDREGEAIAWHVANSFKRARVTATISRVAFNAITKKAVTEAFENAREIDVNLVNAQQARRILDRLVGYEVSPFLWKTIAMGLSAGRVQSVALRVICERENEVLAFKPREYWEIEADFKATKGKKFKAKLSKIDGEKPDLTDKETTEAAVEEIKSEKFAVSQVKIGTRTRKPLPPFITSTIQQEASIKLGFAPNKTMRIAQALYEGIEMKGEEAVGLITYMRTDSVRVEPDAIEGARKFIKSNFGIDFLPEAPVIYKTKKSAQDAHEAIRPTYLEYDPESLKNKLSKERLKLYTLIWDRFIASQMNPAVYDTVSVELTGGKYMFRASSLNLKFEGYLKVYMESGSFGNGNGKEEDKGEIPILDKGADVKGSKFDPTQHFTKPPPRFSEASLVKELEAKGIGRPSTYAQIITTLKQRKYVRLDERRLIPTELGFAVTKVLVGHLNSLFEVEFTATMEEHLDNIEEGDRVWTDVLHEFYDPFSIRMEELKGKAKEIKESMIEQTDEKCENCGLPMIIKWGRNGRFLACTGYPECKTTRPIGAEAEEQEEVDVECEKCGAKMAVKHGRFGKFLGCSNYPKCKSTASITLGIPCPKDKCDGEVVERKSKRGRVFFGCNKYPDCDFASWAKPINEPCKACGHAFVTEKNTKAKGLHHMCPECKVVTFPESEDDTASTKEESVKN